MHLIVPGLLLREVNYKDSDKMVTILTSRYGKIPAMCRGARSQRSDLKAGTQFLTYSEFTLYESRGRYSADKADPIELFMGLRSDIDRLALASYFAEVLDHMSDEGNPADELLKTALNCLYALSNGLKPHPHIKAAFELRAASVSGYAPSLHKCVHCGDAFPQYPVLDAENGCLSCAGCVTPDSLRLSLTPPALTALRYILSAENKKLLSFTVDGDSLRLLSLAAEKYLLYRLEKNLYTLDFYKSLEPII
jgi:DNA repair protein RecO (recombination protein O)